MHDILIIGAGVVGCAIARELSRYDVKTAVIEKEFDVSMGTSRANSAIVHAGYDAKPGTMKAKMNILGNPMFDALSEELGFPFKRIGSLVLGFNADALPKLETLKKRGDKNGVPGLEIIGRERLTEIEPNIGMQAVAALFAPSGGITCPYEMTVALAENANVNGVEFFLGHKVEGISKENDVFHVKTDKHIFEGKILINCAGVFADEIHNMISADKMSIIPRSGQYLLLDRTAGELAAHTLFQIPNDMGKGILVTPTVDGNLLLGPTATDIDDKNDVSTNRESYDEILRAASLSIKNIPVRQAITAFTGLRAHSTDDDFIIGHVPDVSGMIDVAGIESPGLTAAPAIGVYVKALVGSLLDLNEKKDFSPIRAEHLKFRELDVKALAEIIKQDPAYGRIICRCENVSEAEIIAAIHSPIGARDLDGIKRRTRAGMGRCQGGFCSPQVALILARELNIPLTEITKSGPGSEILAGRLKEGI